MRLKSARCAAAGRGAAASGSRDRLQGAHELIYVILGSKQCGGDAHAGPRRDSRPMDGEDPELIQQLLCQRDVVRGAGSAFQAE